MQMLERARRRVRGNGPSDADPGSAPAPEHPTGAVGRLELSLSRDALRRYAPRLAARCGIVDVPNSPDSLSAAIDLAIRQAGGLGRPSVTRSPAGPRTPEYWLISVDGADERTRAILDLSRREELR